MASSSSLGDISSDKVHYWPSFAHPLEDMDLLAELEQREQTKSPSEQSVDSSFDLMSKIGGEDGGGKEEDDEQQQEQEEQVEDEVDENSEEQAVQHDDTQKKSVAILQIHRIGNNKPSKQCSKLKYEFISGIVDAQEEQQQIASESIPENFNPTVAQMIGSLLPEHFGVPLGKLTSQFELQVLIREQFNECSALFVSIDQRKWDTERVRCHGFYQVKLCEKLEEGKSTDGKGNCTKVTMPSVDQSKHRQSPSDTDQCKNNDYKRGGQILFRMTNFNAFSKGCGPKIVFSEPAKMINGMPWRIRVKHCEEHIRLDLFCAADANDKAWTVRAAFTVGVVAHANIDQCKRKKGNLDDFRLFDAVGPCWGSEKFAKIEKLMDLQNGIYDEKGDAVTFKAEVCAEEPKGMRGVRKEDTLLVNNDKVFYVNKFALALHSKHFQKLLFGENAQKTPKVFFNGDQNAMANFERLVAATMYPQNLELDDGCVEGVLLLAHHFQFEDHKNRCVDFLLTKSKKSAIYKFRLAHQCGIIGMKKKVLKEMTKDDFAVAGDQFVDNLLANKKLGDEAVKELQERHKELFGTK